MPPPLPPETRAAILASIQAAAAWDGTGRRPTRNGIARQYGVATRTVTKIAQAEGFGDWCTQSQTVKGVRARQFDAARARADLIRESYEVAGRLLRRVEQPHTVAVGTYKDLPVMATTKLPALRDAQAGMSAFAIGVDKALRMEDRQATTETAEARSLLGALFDSLQRAHADPADGSG